MKTKVSVFIATSLDGFIARKDGNLDWLNQANESIPKGEDCGYQAFIDSVDVLIMGRNTYEQVLSFGEWPYRDKSVIVLSSKTINIPVDLQPTVSASSETPKDLVDCLSSQEVKHLYIDGGVTIQRFLAAGLIDELTITLIPVILGDGKPLFASLKNDVLLNHIATKIFDFGFVQVKYQVRKFWEKLVIQD